MSLSPSPVVASWELVLRLRQRRVELELSINDVADPLGFSRNYWSAIENERKTIPSNTLRAVFDILGFGDQERQELTRLHTASKAGAWWNKYSSYLDNDLQRLIGLEHGARRIRNYEPILIPGLLQTADYTRAIMDSGITVAQKGVEPRVALRLHRQSRLVDDDPVELQALITEATLRQQIGGVTTLRGQLDHLLGVIDQHSNVDIRVIPFTSGACTIFGANTMSLLDFPSPRLPVAAWIETVSTRGIVTDADQVRDMTLAYDEARDHHTLDPRETKKVIEKHRKELR